MQRPYSNAFTPINNPMDQTHEPDEHLFDDEDNMDLSGLPHDDLLPDTTHDPAWEPDYDSYELPDAAPPSYEESTSGGGGGGGGIDLDPSTLTATTDPQTFFSPTASSQPQPVPQQPRPARPRLRRMLARISSSSSPPPSPPLPPVTTYSSSAHSPPRQAVHDRTTSTTSSSSSSSSESPDGGVPLDPTTTVPALICQHAVPLPAPGQPIPPRCPPCTTIMHRAYTLQMKMEWDLARLDPDTSHAERSAACRAYFRARADEQNYQDGLEDGGRAEEALREAATAARRHRGAQRAVFFEAGTPLVSRGRAAGTFKRESRCYVPGRWAGEWEDTSGMRQSFSEYYDVMADYDEEAIVDDDDDEEEVEEEEYYDEDDDEEMCDDEDDDEEYKYYDEGYAAGME